MTNLYDRDEAAAGSAERGGPVGFRPLYRQVRELLLRRLAEGVWQPGQLLPSEGQLAAELGVSQGTVRKALDALTADRLLVRRQGRGTFVAEHDEQRILFHFFKLMPDEGAPSFPQSRMLAVTEATADASERERLALDAGAGVVRVRRLRSLSGITAIVEDIVLPEAAFPGIAGLELPNNLYGLYAARFGVTVGRAQERLKAVPLSAADAALLGTAEGTPALQIDRIAQDLDQRPVEWRLSLCLTDRLHYRSDLR